VLEQSPPRPRGQDKLALQRGIESVGARHDGSGGAARFVSLIQGGGGIPQWLHRRLVRARRYRLPYQHHALLTR
jgi:hypothetical protein